VRLRREFKDRGAGALSFRGGREPLLGMAASNRESGA